MLELRPNCECCDKDLPPDSPEAFYLFVRVHLLPGLHDDATERTLPELRRRTGAAPCASRRGAAAPPRLHPAPPCTVGETQVSRLR